jgi:cob(I)alamin adenosyltransferase
MNSIVTKTGDDGTTSLLYNKRVNKFDDRIEVVGDIDELNSALGLVKCAYKTYLISCSTQRIATINNIQSDLISLMGEISCQESDFEKYLNSKFGRIEENDIKRLEYVISEIEVEGFEYSGWVTPGANPPAAALDFARSVCRRAERHLAYLYEDYKYRPILKQYLNRLSDCLWLLARETEYYTH